MPRSRDTDVHTVGCAASAGFHLEDVVATVVLVSKPSEEKSREKVLTLGSVAVEPTEVVCFHHFLHGDYERAGLKRSNDLIELAHAATLA